MLHPRIDVTTPPTAEELQCMADIKAIQAHGAGLELLLDELAKNPDYDMRWAAIARTELQQGLMALTRSVARPTSF